MAFQPGQSGNPSGRSKERIWRNAIERAVTRASTEGMQAIDNLADSLVKAGLTGDVPALREIGDRLDGKVPQGLAGETGEGPVELVITWKKNEAN